MPYVVDSNVMNYFQIERKNDEYGTFQNAIDIITTNSSIALDDGEICMKEWLSCAEGAYPLALSDWINDMLVAQKIQLFEMSSDPKYNVLKNLGIPKKDHKWIKLAYGSNSEHIVTEDIDLFDPKKKNASQKVKKKIIINCKGPVARFLKKKGIEVICCDKLCNQ